MKRLYWIIIQLLTFPHENISENLMINIGNPIVLNDNIIEQELLKFILSNLEKTIKTELVPMLEDIIEINEKDYFDKIKQKYLFKRRYMFGFACLVSFVVAISLMYLVYKQYFLKKTTSVAHRKDTKINNIEEEILEDKEDSNLILEDQEYLGLEDQEYLDLEDQNRIKISRLIGGENQETNLILTQSTVEQKMEQQQFVQSQFPYSSVERPQQKQFRYQDDSYLVFEKEEYMIFYPENQKEQIFQRIGKQTNKALNFLLQKSELGKKIQNQMRKKKLKMITSEGSIEEKEYLCEGISPAFAVKILNLEAGKFYIILDKEILMYENKNCIRTIKGQVSSCEVESSILSGEIFPPLDEFNLNQYTITQIRNYFFQFFKKKIKETQDAVLSIPEFSLTADQFIESKNCFDQGGQIFFMVRYNTTSIVEKEPTIFTLKNQDLFLISLFFNAKNRKEYITKFNVTTLFYNFQPYYPIPITKHMTEKIRDRCFVKTKKLCFFKNNAWQEASYESLKKYESSLYNLRINTENFKLIIDFLEKEIKEEIEKITITDFKSESLLLDKVIDIFPTLKEINITYCFDKNGQIYLTISYRKKTEMHPVFVPIISSLLRIKDFRDYYSTLSENPKQKLNIDSDEEYCQIEIAKVVSDHLSKKRMLLCTDKMEIVSYERTEIVTYDTLQNIMPNLSELIVNEEQFLSIIDFFQKIQQNILLKYLRDNLHISFLPYPFLDSLPELDDIEYKTKYCINKIGNIYLQFFYQRLEGEPPLYEQEVFFPCEIPVIKDFFRAPNIIDAYENTKIVSGLYFITRETREKTYFPIITREKTYFPIKITKEIYKNFLDNIKANGANIDLTDSKMIEQFLPK